MIASSPALPESRRHERFIGWVASVWLVAFYFLCRPYRGVRHDAQLYFGQAQNHLTPEWMSHDLFFQHGSQDRFSIFSALFGPVLRVFGLVHAEVGAMLALHVLFWFTAWVLVRRVASPVRWGMLASVAVLPHYYGAAMTFSFAEPFLTARTLAEPFCLLALAAIAQHRRGWAIVWLLVALAAHPLIALPAWAIVWYVLIERDQRWAWAALMLIAIAGAGLLGVAPFDGLFKRIDGQWYAHVADSNSFDFMLTWGKETWTQALFDVCVLGLASLLPDMPLRSLYRASAVTTIFLCALSALLVDGVHLELPTQLQLWRALWLAHFLALLVLLPLALALWRKGNVGQLAAAMLGLAAVIVAAEAITSFAFAIAALFVSAAAMRGAQMNRRVAIFGVVICIVGAIVMGLIQAIFDMLIVLQNVRSGIPFGRLGSIPAAIAQLMLVIAWVGIITASRSKRRWALPTSLCVGIVMAVLAAMHWDQRDFWARELESHYGLPNPFKVELPLTAQVYWPGEVLAPWILMQRPNYASLADEAAAVFGRESTLELERRWKVVLPMSTQIDACMKLVQSGRANFSMDQCKYTDIAIHDVCHAAGAPDDVVLMNVLRKPPLSVWNRDDEYGRHAPFYLYACSQF